MKSICLIILWMSMGLHAATEKTISCELMGGLGNQLFQIANALAVGWDDGMHPIFPKINQSISRVAPRPVYWETVFHRLETCPPSEISHFVPYEEESSLVYKKIEISAPQVRLMGYFQSWRYFDRYRDKILEAFCLPQHLMESVEKRYRDIVAEGSENTVSIHIRYDDTLLVPVKGVIDFFKEPYDEYYDEAIALFPEDATFVVIADNCEMARQLMKEKLGDRHAVYVCGTDYLDLFLMSLCKHNIIVNSTYSWWGAYLNRNPDKIVVSPKYWQCEGNYPYRPEYLMPGWTLIENFYQEVP